MTDAEFDRLEEDLKELQAETAAALAEDLGGDPEDYRVEEPVPDGGDAED